MSAWVLPTELGEYREILRQECERRVLFSFQHGGMILSLGLHIDGYRECDGPIDPSMVLDGSWHHCAGTFDGEAMRVYVDGVEVGDDALAHGETRLDELFKALLEELMTGRLSAVPLIDE